MKAPLQRAIKAGVRVFFIYGDAGESINVINIMTLNILPDFRFDLQFSYW
jgi:hypothetical protein